MSDRFGAEISVSGVSATARGELRCHGVSGGVHGQCRGDAYSRRIAEVSRWRCQHLRMWSVSRTCCWRYCMHASGVRVVYGGRWVPMLMIAQAELDAHD